MAKKPAQGSLLLPLHVFDASSLINIERNKKMKELRERKGSILIPEKIAFEVAFNSKIPSTAPLKKFVPDHPELVAKFTQDEEDEYLQLRSETGIDDGEAAAIAVAYKRKLPLVIEDEMGKTKAQSLGIPTKSWKEFLGI